MKAAVTVYGASSTHIDEKYFRVGRSVGRLLAEAGADVINGGGAVGLMGATIDGALEAGGTAIGIIPEFMAAKGWGHKSLTRMIVAADMHSRKKAMADMSTAVIALPGGVGTLDELMEIITWRQLRLYTGQVVILNTDGFYDPLLAMLARAEEQGFMRKGAEQRLFTVAATPEEAVRLALQ